MASSRPREQRVHMEDPVAVSCIAQTLNHFFAGLRRSGPSPVVLCIGTDRSTGDALGPLVGTLLVEHGFPAERVFGTLADPVHASNLEPILRRVQRPERCGAVLAVDACLGKQEMVGMIAVGRGSLRPGAGVNKSLPEAGDVYVTGTVNVGGFMEYFVLQNTRLGLVMRMARTIADGIYRSFASEAHVRT